MDEKEKKIDESWKDAIGKERDGLLEGNEAGEAEINFVNFVTSLSMQTLIALSEIENPFTKKKEENLVQAKIIIDTLDMIKDKTKNNLEEYEAKLLEGVLYELKMHYVSKNKGETK